MGAKLIGLPQAKSDKEYRDRAVKILEQAADKIRNGEAEPVEMFTYSTDGVYRYYGIQWMTVKLLKSEGL